MHMQYQMNDVSTVGPAQPHVNGAAQNSITEPPNAASIDDLISSASKQADANAAAAAHSTSQAALKVDASGPQPTLPTAATPPAAAAREETVEDKGAKKEKDKPKTTRLVYSDNDTSPEEKMAMLSRYAFTTEQRSVMA